MLDFDLHAAASLPAMGENLAGPLQAGFVQTVVPASAAGVVQVAAGAREPLLLVAPKHSLDATGLRITTTLPGGAPRELVFAPFTEAGSFLPLYRPPVDVNGIAPAFALTLTMARIPADATPIAVGELASTFELRLVEGILGRLLYVLSAEKSRLRREGREIGAMRQLRHARDNALDRIGSELGVPRFVESHDAGGSTVLDREPDADFRRRLGVYRPWLVPNARHLLSVLNGSGTGNNAGPLGELGLTQRFALVEEDNPFAVTMAIVAAGDPDVRARFLEFVRRVHLIWPQASASANAVHTARFSSKSRTAHEEALRQGLRSNFQFGEDASTDAALAPMLATALVRAGAIRKLLGLSGKWQLTRAQRADRGSRYELGLGADVAPFTTAELNTMRGQAATATSTDSELTGVLDAIRERTAAGVPTASQDPDATWLLEPCGLRTAHRVDSSTLYLSNFPTSGLVINGPTPVPAKGYALLVPGYFGDRRMFGDLLRYDRSGGRGEFVGIGFNDFSEESQLVSASWRTTWTHIVGGRFSKAHPSLTALCFYEAPSGTMQFYYVTQAGIGVLGNMSTRTTWSSIVTCELGYSMQALLCYDRMAGEAQFFTTDGSGTFNAQGGTIKKLRKGWTHVVVGDFGGHGQTDFFFYDAHRGDGTFFTVDGPASLTPFAEAAWETAWTHVAVAPLTKGDHDDLVLYDARGGAALIETVQDGGARDSVWRSNTFRAGWTHLVAGDHGGTARLTFYDRVAGEAEHMTYDANDGLHRRRLVSGWLKADGTTFEAHYNASGDPGSNIVLANGVEAAAIAWTGAGNAAWQLQTATSSPTQQARWSAAVAPAAPARTAFLAAGLPVATNVPSLVTALGHLPGELVNTLELSGAFAASVLAGNAGAAATLRTLVESLRSGQLASVLPLPTSGGTLLLVVSVVSLPQAGINLSNVPTSGFRWYVVPIEGPGGAIRTVGARTEFVPAGEGLSAIVAIGYARQGLTDPYEYRVDLPTGALLNMREYEFLMNVLADLTPAGVRINTWNIRREHVDVDGNGTADKLDPTVSRTYRTFRRRRHIGAASPNLTEE